MFWEEFFFITEHRLVGVPKLPGTHTLDQPPAPSPAQPVSAGAAMLSALPKFRDFYSSLSFGINKRASVCSPLSGRKGHWGSAADGSGCFFGCRKSGLSWQARSEVWMGENKWSVIGFFFFPFGSDAGFCFPV